MAEHYNQENALNEEFGHGEEIDNIDRLKQPDITELKVETDVQRNTDGKRGENEANCEGKGCLLSVLGHFALYLCYICNIYLCEKCLKDHRQEHKCVKVKSEDLERENMAHMLVGKMRSERSRELNLDAEETKVYGRVHVKDDLDKKDCDITGICGLQNKRFVVLDSNNSCMKIFSCVTHTLLRFIRFKSFPGDVTEIRKWSSKLDSASDSYQGEKQCLLAVTFTYEKQIWFIDVNNYPAVKAKTINVKKYCGSIDYNGDNVFSLCWEYIQDCPRFSVDIFSLGKKQHVKIIQLDIDTWSFPLPNLAVYQDKIYVTDVCNKKILCLTVEDRKIISHIRIKKSELRGISVESKGTIYVCDGGNNKVHRLSSDLSAFEPLRLDSDFTQTPFSICFTVEKLFFGHSSSPLNNYVTVVQLT